MGNPIAISPAVMINRIAHESGTPAGAHLAKVAELRLRLQTEANDQQHHAALLSPNGEAEPPLVDSGAAVDRLI